MDIKSTFELDIDGSEFASSAICKAIKEQNHYKLLASIHQGENIHLRDHEFNNSYLHFIVNSADSTSEDKYVPMVYQLSNAGIDVNAMDYKGRSALELAIFRELLGLMTALLRVGTDASGKDYKAIIRDYGSPFEYEILNTFEKYEPGLWQATKNNDTGMVHMLVNSWCRVNIRNKNKTLIQYARRSKKSEELTELLEDFEVTLEFVHATLAGDEKRMLEFLMDSKPCDPNIMDISYQERWSRPLTPRSLRDTAIGMGHTHVLHLLPEGESDNEGDGQWGQGHKGHKECSATVMGVTSLAELPIDDYMLDQELPQKKKNVPGDKEDVQDYQYFHPTSFQNGVRHIGNVIPSVKIQPPTTIPELPPTLQTGANEPLKIDEKCYYFHEVDSFAGQRYQPPTHKGPLYRSIKSSSQSTKYNYSHSRKILYPKTAENKHSKMCVIS